MSEIIAKAMNSTIGTSDFKSFDQLLREHKILVPSDKIYAPILTGEYNVSGGSATSPRTVPGKLVALTDGVVDVRIALYLTQSQGVSVAPAVNGVIRGEFVYMVGAQAGATHSFVSNWKNITIRKGDEITIVAFSSTGGIVTQAYVLAEVTDKYYLT